MRQVYWKTTALVTIGCLCVAAPTAQGQSAIENATIVEVEEVAVVSTFYELEDISEEGIFLTCGDDTLTWTTTVDEESGVQ